MGKSWGGFNGLQVAARRPPALKAIITAYSTDDRFRDDIHLHGRVPAQRQSLVGGDHARLPVAPARSRDRRPVLVGKLLKRLDHLPFFPALWMRHQRYDDYWRHGSCRRTGRPSSARCSRSAAGPTATPMPCRAFSKKLHVPRLGIIGPWGHIYPQDGVPGPAIGFLQEAVRWWDHWLKGDDRGIMQEPMLRAWLSDSYPPNGNAREDAGPLGRGSHNSLPADLPACPRSRAGRVLASSTARRSPESDPIRSPQSHGRAAANGWARAASARCRWTSGWTMAARFCSRRRRSARPCRSSARRFSTCASSGRAAGAGRGSPVRGAAGRRGGADFLQVLNLAHRDGHEASRGADAGRMGGYPRKAERLRPSHSPPETAFASPSPRLLAPGAGRRPMPRR